MAPEIEVLKRVMVVRDGQVEYEGEYQLMEVVGGESWRLLRFRLRRLPHGVHPDQWVDVSRSRNRSIGPLKVFRSHIPHD